MKRAGEPEIKLDGLINKIKSEGIEEANRQAEEIINEGKKKADALIDEAKKEVESRLEKAAHIIEEKEQASKKSIELAARDSLLSLKESLRKILESLVKNDFDQLMAGEVLENLLLKTIESWSRNRDSDSGLEVLLSEKERNALTDTFMKSLGDHLKAGVEFKVHRDIKSGFRVGMQGEHMHYDLTEESISDLLIAHLNKKLATIFNDMKDQKKQQG